MSTMRFLGLPALLFLVSCTNAAVDQQKRDDAPQVVLSSLPDFSATDSLELIYFPDPANQRAYKRLVIADTLVISSITQAVMQNTASRAECPHPVKLYLFRKGEVYKTIYANTSDSCRYFAYAVGAKPVYVPMEAGAALLVDSLVRETH